MEKITKSVKDALQLHIDRNEFLKDSEYAEFANSDNEMMKELMEVYTKILMKNMNRKLMKNMNGILADVEFDKTLDNALGEVGASKLKGDSLFG